MNKNLFKKFAFAGLAVTATFSFASCGKKKADGYTYRTTTTVSPSNWNELTQQDANDDQISEHLRGNFFVFDYKFDAEGNPVKNDFTVNYSAATKLTDVTGQYAGNEKYSVPSDAQKGYAYKITLRNDLKWNDGTEIKAKDFVYSMKEQLNPLFKNYRADSYYIGSTVIHNAKNYVKQGESGWFSARDVYGTYNTENGNNLIFKLGPSDKDAASSSAASASASYRKPMGLGATGLDDTLAEIASYTGLSVDALRAIEGKTLTEILANDDFKATFDGVIGWWKTEPEEELDFFVSSYTFPELSFDNVGIFAQGDYDLVLVLDNPLMLLEDDGSLSYKAAYNLSSLPLVKEDLYEANKKSPVQGSSLWTTTYNSSVSSTASWGPYMLTEYQGGKSYTLSRNDNWYGYNMDLYKGQYQANKISCETIADYQTRLLKFLAGDIDDIGIDASVAADYRNSEQALFTPSSYVGSLQLQSSKEALTNRQSNGVNKVILTYVDFRKALSLSIDRAALVQSCTTSSLPGYGLYNSVHYYDVAHGKAYRDTVAAKKALLDAYGVEYNDSNLEEKYKTITGFDLTQARQLITKAYNDCLAAGEIKAGDTVELVYGCSADTEADRRYFEFFKKSFAEAAKTTPLEGKLTLKFDASFGDQWSEQFRGGAYDVANCGWSGAAWDPGYFLLAYLGPQYMYSAAWDTSTEMLEFTMPGQYLADGKDLTMKLSALEWYNILNGQENSKGLDWSAGSLPDDGRVLLIAALEKLVLSKYYSVPMINSYSSEMISYKIEYITRDYNTFMGYGGIRYLSFNYSDNAWAKYVKSQGGTLSYKG